jgi:hypothetical protein
VVGRSFAGGTGAGAINIILDRPAAPRLARALALLLDEINATPPRMPATPGPSTTASPRR